MNRSQFLRLALASAAVPLGAALVARSGSAQGTDDLAGRVVRLKGSASAMQDSVPRPLKVDEAIFRGDVISTGREARLEMKMLDDTVVTLGERTVFVVIDYVGGGPTPKAAMRLIDGVLTLASGAIAAASGGSMRIATEVATVGIRGTTAWVGKLTDELEIGLLTEGRVTVENGGGRVELTQLGHGTRIPNWAEAPTAPINWGGPKLELATQRVRF